MQSDVGRAQSYVCLQKLGKLREAPDEPGFAEYWSRSRREEQGPVTYSRRKQVLTVHSTHTHTHPEPCKVTLLC